MDRDEDKLRRSLDSYLKKPVERWHFESPEEFWHKLRGTRSPRHRLWPAGVAVAACLAVFLPVLYHTGPSAHQNTPFPATAINPPFSTAMDFLTMKTGFLGVNSAVLSTTNGGQSWNRHPLPSHETANVIDFLTPSLGWVLAQGGSSTHPTISLLKTTDGGQRWTQELVVHTGLSATLTMTASGGYAVIGQRLYHNQGTNGAWHSVPLPTGAIPSAVSALSGQQAWVAVGVGSHYTLLSTTNGGRTFTSIFHTSHGAIIGCEATSASTGHLLLGPPGGYESPLGPLETTTNGGRSWSPSTVPANGLYAGMSFPQGPDAWIGTTNGAQGIMSTGLLVSADHGTHWTAIGSRRGWSLRTISMVAPGKGYVMGLSVSGTPFLAKTTDNGGHWTQVWPQVIPVHTDFVSPTQGYGLGLPDNSRAILITHDGGAHWTIENSRPGATFSQVSFWGNTGLAIASAYNSGGKSMVDVYRTTNEGASWHRVSALPTSLSLGIHLFGKNQAILTTFGHVYSSVDGGHTWSLLATTPLSSGKSSATRDFIGVHQSWVFSSANGWGHGAHLSFVDHGISHAVYNWPASPGILYESGTTVDFLNRQVGWLILQKLVRTHKTFTKPGSSRKFFVIKTVDQLIHTTDGGKTWTLDTTLPSNLAISSGPQFVSNKVGFMAVYNQILTTNDGGRVWTTAP